MALSDIYQKASLVQIPSGYKSGTLYSVVPNTSSGDFTVTGDPQGKATRVNKDGLIESVAADVPRLNYDFSNPQDPHLLLEPERSNLIVRSEEFNLWGDTGVTVTENATTAPTGTQTADLLTSTAVNWRRSINFAISNEAVYSFSCFVKKHTTTNNIRFELYKGTSASLLDFEFTTKTITASDTSLTNLKVENYTNDWYRVSCKFTANGTNFICYAYPSQGYSSSGSAYFWGAQLEAGSYPTSYIPTSGSAVTRTADNAHLLNQTLITDYPFTVYTNAKIDAVSNSIFSLNNTSNSSYYLVFSLLGGSQVAVFRRNPSASSSDFWNFSYTVGDTIKVAVAFISATAYKLYINGTEIADRTSGTSIPFNHDDISLGQFRITGDTGTRNSVNEFMLFNEALTDAELITLTT